MRNAKCSNTFFSLNERVVMSHSWTYGAITNLILDPRFVSDLFALGPKFYRSPYGPTELVAYEKATKQTAFSERASL